MAHRPKLDIVFDEITGERNIIDFIDGQKAADWISSTLKGLDEEWTDEQQEEVDELIEEARSGFGDSEKRGYGTKFEWSDGSLELNWGYTTADPSAKEVLEALHQINAHRARIGQAPLDPVAAEWTPDDVLDHARELRKSNAALKRRLIL